MTDASKPKLTIHVINGELHVAATDGETSLIEQDAPIYVRAGLVRPTTDEVPAAKGRKTRVARAVPVTAPMLVDYLSRSAIWMRFDKRSNEWTAIDPPSKVAATILSRDGEWRLRKLAGIITAPTMRPDGTILATPGYDEATQLLLLDPPPVPTILDRPTREDALASLRALEDLLAEFPFLEDDASKSVALAALITPVVRGALQTSPMFASTAPVPGSGKSFLWDLPSAIACGDRAPVLAAGKTDEETEKRLASALIDGLSIISIDNVNGELGGDALCQFIERPVVKVRPLGVSKLVHITNNATFFATGNNIQILGDMTRRTLLCTLDPKVERPELRKFRLNPFDAILADRGKYIAAALTICRAYAVAGSPGRLSPLASFEDWSDRVRSALVWLGCPDPCDTMDAARSDDPVLSDLSTILHAWRDAIGCEARTTASVISAANDRHHGGGGYIYPELREALLGQAVNARGDLDARRLGKYLGRHKGRIVDGLRLVAGKDSHAKVVTWSVGQSGKAA